MYVKKTLSSYIANFYLYLHYKLSRYFLITF